jgi:hypothetical protein
VWKFQDFSEKKNILKIQKQLQNGKHPHSSANRQIVISAVGKTALTKDNH